MSSTSFNKLADRAKEAGRDYITPEDVAEMLKLYCVHQVRFELLGILAEQYDLGVEDARLCAFVAWENASRKNAGD